MTRYYDFDAAASEPEPITVRVLDQDWTLPGSVPAGPLLAYERLLIVLDDHQQSGAKGPAPVIPGDFSVETLARQLAGDETVVAAWLAAGMDYPTLQRTVGRLRRIRMGQDPGLGEPPPPAPTKRGAARSRSRTSSPAGPN